MSDADFWGEPIFVYTRAQAIDDGVLVAVPEAIAREAGFKIPVALTAGVNAILDAPSATGESREGRLWDVLSLARFGLRARLARGQTDDAEYFEYRLTFEGQTHTLVCAFNPVDGFTIMLPGED